MRPRSISRGNPRLHDAGVFAAAAASMRPRSISRGNGSVAGDALTLWFGFNEAPIN